MPTGHSLHYFTHSCGFHEEGLPEPHLTVEPPEQYHEGERLDRWAAACWAGGAPLRYRMKAYRTCDVPAWRESLCG